MIETNTKTKIQTIACLVMLLFLCVMNPISPAQAQFIIAWDYESEAGNGFDYDEYGQGFFLFIVFENETFDGDWKNVGGIHYFNESHVFNWTVGWAIRLQYAVWMNSTLTGASDLEDGENYVRLNVTVETPSGIELDSHEDIESFYATSWFDPVMWFYQFEVILNIIPVAGALYIVKATYEVYW